MRSAPSPRATNGGSPPTALNARTGEFTPPGITSLARASSFDERDTDASSARERASNPRGRDPAGPRGRTDRAGADDHAHVRRRPGQTGADPPAFGVRR